MYALMLYQNTLSTECLSTHFTGIRSLTSMYSLMSFKTALFNVWFITHFTGIRSLTSMHALMFLQIYLLTECYITHFTGIRALTSVQALMFSKTTRMTEHLITHFTWITMLTPVYITGISAFSTLYMKLFIQSALVKIQRLNIRIYYDRKNNYFLNYTYTYIYKIKSITFEELCYLQHCIRWLTMFCIISSSNKTPAITFMSQLFYSAIWNAFCNIPSTTEVS